MEVNKKQTDQTEKTSAVFNDSGQSAGFENVKNSIADKLHHIAEAIGEKISDQEEHSGAASCGKRASEWLEHSAEYVRQFDYQQADAKVRELVRQNPGQSLLIAGAVGLMIGVILRRR